MNPVFGDERHDMGNPYTRYLWEREEMGTFGVAQKKHLFMLEYVADNGERHTMNATGYDHFDARKALPEGAKVVSVQKII